MSFEFYLKSKFIENNTQNVNKFGCVIEINTLPEISVNLNRCASNLNSIFSAYKSNESRINFNFIPVNCIIHENRIQLVFELQPIELKIMRTIALQMVSIDYFRL